MPCRHTRITSTAALSAAVASASASSDDAPAEEGVKPASGIGAFFDFKQVLAGLTVSLAMVPGMGGMAGEGGLVHSRTMWV
jgi:hypothetical protein